MSFSTPDKYSRLTTWGKQLRLHDIPIKDIEFWNVDGKITRGPPKGLLDTEFDASYGRAKGPSFYAYTSDLIIFCWEYDGSEGLKTISRNPTPGDVPTHI